MPPERASYAETIRDLKQLQAAYEEHAELLGDIPEKKSFDAKLLTLEELRAQADSLKTARQSITIAMFNALLEVREEAMKLRAAAKLKIGPRSELLVRFGIVPLRLRLQKPRSRKKKEEPTPPPPVETATEAAKKREAA